MKFIHENPWLGYKSLSAFVTAGTRKLLQESHREVYEKMLMESGRLPPAGHEVRMPEDPRPILIRNGRDRSG